MATEPLRFVRRHLSEVVDREHELREAGAAYARGDVLRGAAAVRRLGR
jgi:hypothetical protein